MKKQAVRYHVRPRAFVDEWGWKEYWGFVAVTKTHPWFKEKEIINEDIYTSGKGNNEFIGMDIPKVPKKFRKSSYKVLCIFADEQEGRENLISKVLRVRWEAILKHIEHERKKKRKSS